MSQPFAEELLEQWGKWVWQKTGVPRYVSPMLALMRDHVPSTHAPDAAISDEDAETVSAIVARLKRGYPESYEVLEKHYVFNMSLESIGPRMERQKLSRYQVKERLVGARWYVQAELDRRSEAA